MLTRLSWECPGCGHVHAFTHPDRAALFHDAQLLMANGARVVILEDEARALEREMDMAELNTPKSDVPAWEPTTARRSFWDPRRYRKD